LGLSVKRKAKDRKMALFRWAQGRQKGGYWKMALLPDRVSRALKADLWILRYPDGSSIPEHSDPVPGRRHWRLNVVLWAPRAGGVFSCKAPGPKASFAFGQRVFLFRSDLCPHQVSRVEGGSRWVLSAGVALPGKPGASEKTPAA
jgi:hypothetical protein